MASSDFFRVDALRQHVWNVCVASVRAHVSAGVNDETGLLNAEGLSTGAGGRLCLHGLLVLLEVRA
jgi:hypothetical protein